MYPENDEDVFVMLNMNNDHKLTIDEFNEVIEFLIAFNTKVNKRIKESSNAER